MVIEAPPSIRLGSCSRAGVVLRVQLLEPFARHVRVDLRGRYVGVPEQQLHYAQIRAVIEQVGREGVPHRVR